MDYRTYIQSVYDNSADGTAAKHQAGALLNVVGNDGMINANYIANPKAYAASVGKDMLNYYDAIGINQVNDQFKSAYQNAGNAGSVLGATYGGSGGSSSSYNPADLAYLDDQQARLNSQKGYAERALSDGLTQLGDSYNKEVTDANQKRSRALEDFETKRSDTTTAKNNALERNDDSARTLADSVRRRLGLASGSNSSAYQLAAPGAVARQATKSRTGILENYGQNFRDLNTTEERAKVDFQGLLDSLDAQRKSRESDFRSGMLSKMNDIDTSSSEVARQRALVKGGGYNQVKTAMAPYSSAIDSRNSEIAGLFDKYRTPYNVKAIDVNTPNLRDYEVDKTTISGGNNATTDPSTYNPYYQFLKKENEQYAY